MAIVQPNNLASIHGQQPWHTVSVDGTEIIGIAITLFTILEIGNWLRIRVIGRSHTPGDRSSVPGGMMPAIRRGR